MAQKIYNRKDFSFFNLKMDELTFHLSPFELSCLLADEKLTTDTDILLENMLSYFVENELYEYACVVRDEVNDRK